jgi:hypothetical protein
LVQPSSMLADEKNTLLEQIKNKVILIGCIKPHHHHYNGFFFLFLNAMAGGLSFIKRGEVMYNRMELDKLPG